MKRVNITILASLSLMFGSVLNAQELDSTFGEDGFIPYGGPISNSENNLLVATKMGFQSDGKIVIGTRASTDYVTYLYRYLQNGEADPTYGINGVAKIFTGSDSECHDLKIQDDDKTVIVSETGYCINGVCGAPQFLMMRVLPNGEIDSTFGVDGRLLSNHIFGSNGTYGVAVALEILDNGKFIISGRGENSKPFIARLNQNGFPDNSFGNNGFFYGNVGAVKGLTIDDENNIYMLLAKNEGDKYVSQIIKTDASGNLVPGFGNNGSIQFTNSSDTTNDPTGIDFTDGKLIVSSKSYNPNIYIPPSNFFRKYNSYLHFFDKQGNYTNPTLSGGIKITIPEDSTVIINDVYARDGNNFLVGGRVYHLEAGNFQNRAFVGLVDSTGTFNNIFGANGYMLFDEGISSQTGWNGKLAEVLDIDIDENNSLYMAGFKNPIAANTMRSILLGKINNVAFQEPDHSGIKEYDNYVVYPNPSKGSFYVQAKQGMNSQYVVYNLSGVEVCKGKLHQKKTPISIPEKHTAGMYILKISSGDQHSFHKIIKN